MSRYGNGALVGFPEKGNISVTLGQLDAWWILHGNCFACAHVGPVDRYELARRHGKTVPLKALEQNLRCRKCGNRTFNGWLVSRMPRD